MLSRKSEEAGRRRSARSYLATLVVVALAGGARAQGAAEVTSPPPTPPGDTPPGVDDGAAAPSPTSAPTPPTRRGVPSKAPPLDLCAVKPDAASSYYQRQRVLLLNALVDGVADGPEDESNDKGIPIPGVQHQVLASVHAGELARLVLMSQFPMQRLYVVSTPAPADSSLVVSPSLTRADVAAAANQDDFAAYSAGCADWVAIPQITRTSATWQKVEREKTVVVNGNSATVKYLAWTLSTNFAIGIRLYKRSGDGFRWVHTLQSDSGSLGGLAASSAERDRASIDYRAFASTWPVPGCVLGAPVDGRPGLVGGCAGIEPEFSADLEQTELSSGEVCDDVDDAVGAGATSMQAVARCEVTRAMEKATILVQLAAKRFWPMYASLVEVNLGGAKRPALRLGARDGVKRGDYYIADGLSAKRTPVELGFARVVRLGPGGPAGEEDPSILDFKSGGAPPGSKMTEYALLGVQVGLRPGVLLLGLRGDLNTRFAVGGEGTIAYDVSRHVPIFDEAWLRANVGYFQGTSKEGFVAVDVGPEFTSYLGGGFATVLGVAFSELIASHKEHDALANRDVTWSGGSAGALARLSLEYAFGPDWNMALIAEGRAGLSKAMLSTKDDPSKIAGGSLTGGLGLLTVGHTF